MGGREAIETVKKRKPDIAIVDITMPDMDGLEVTRRIREVARETQVLILTMHESDQMVRGVLEMGARGYVLKSDLASHLVQAVKDLAHGKISLTPKVSAMVLEGFLKGGESKQPKNGHARPTPREIEIIRQLAAGKTNKEIAVELGITLRTVETHRRTNHDEDGAPFPDGADSLRDSRQNHNHPGFLRKCQDLEPGTECLTCVKATRMQLQRLSMRQR